MQQCPAQITANQTLPHFVHASHGNAHDDKNHRAKRIGKVIPYKRSELRSIEVMEKVRADALLVDISAPSSTNTHTL